MIVVVNRFTLQFRGNTFNVYIILHVRTTLNAILHITGNNAFYSIRHDLPITLIIIHVP